MVAIVEERRKGVNQTSECTHDIIKRVSAAVKQRDEIRAKLARILLDDRQKSKVIKGYGAIELIEKIYLDYKDNPALFFQVLKNKKEEIRKSDPELAILIDKSDKKIDPLIQGVYTIFTTYPKERVFEHFRRFYRGYYRERLQNLENKEAGTKLGELILRFILRYDMSNKQVLRIKEFYNVVSNWGLPQYIVQYVKEEESIIGYLEKIDDEEINRFLEEHKRRSLFIYYKEILYFVKLLKQISLGEEEATWKDFDLFYDDDIDLDKKKISERLEKEFYDKKRAEKLQELRKRLHKFPEGWKRELNKIIIELRNESPSIKEAKEALQRLFIAVIQRIDLLLEKETRNIIEEMGGIIAGIKLMPKKSMMILLRAVKKKKKLADEKLKRKRDVYEKNKDKAFSVVSAFEGAVHKFFIGLNLDDFIIGVYRLRKGNIRLTGPMVETSKRFSKENPAYDMKVLARLKGFVVGIMANDREMLDRALGVRRSTLENYKEVIEKQSPAIEALDGLIDNLLNLIESYEVLRNQRFLVPREKLGVRKNG